MSKRILVVEDDEDSRRILRDLLVSAGYQMLEVEDGEQGIAVAEAQRPDLILMDIQLPLVDGYEVTRRIKANPKLRTIPIIVVTSYTVIGGEDEARAAGCDDYITKPYSPRHGDCGPDAAALYPRQQPVFARQYDRPRNYLRCVGDDLQQCGRRRKPAPSVLPLSVRAKQQAESTAEFGLAQM